MAKDGKNLWQRKRWLRRLTWTGGIIAVLFVLIVFVLPSPLARWVIASQLEDLGIQHDGVGTVDIDLWNRTVSAGPIAVHSGDHSPATLGSVNIAYSLKNLIEQRALIKTFTLTGVDIVAMRHEDGTITVNGIAPPAAEEQELAEAEQPAEEEEGSGFGVGVSTFVFQDSKLILKDFTGGALTLDLERLELSDFQSWEPEIPGTYSLVAGLNGMVIEMAGEAMPFAETIRAKGNMSFSSLTLDGVAAFVGPTGLERQGGEFSLVLQHDVTLAPDGQIRADVNGKAVIREADIATAAGEELALAELDNPFEMVLTVAPDNQVDIDGQSEFTLRDFALRGANQETLTASEITLQLSAMDLVKLAALREGIAPPASSDSQPAAEAGGAQPLISLLLTALIDAGKEVLQHQLEGTAGVAVTLTDVEAVQPATSSTIRLKSGEIAAAGVQLRSTGPFWTMSTPLSVTLDGLDAGSADSKAAIGQVALTMENFEGQTDFRDATITAAIDLTVNALTAAGGGSETSLESLTLKSGPLSITEEGDSGTLETGLNLETGAFRMTGNGMDAALESLQVSGERLTVSEAPDRHSVVGDLQATLGAFRITAGGAKAALASLQVKAAPFAVSASGGETSLDAGLTLEAGKLDVEAEGAQAGMDGLSLHASSLKAGGQPGAATLTTAMSSNARGVNIALGGEAPAKVSAGQIAMAFDPLSFAQANGNTSVSGKIEVQNADAEADGTAAKVASLVLALKNIAGKVMPAPDLKGSATLSAGNISVSQAATGMQASVGSVELQADSLQVSEAENALSGGVKVASVEAMMEGEEPVNATVGGVDVSGLSLRLPAGSAPAVAMNNIMIDALQAEVSVAAFGKQGQQPAAGEGASSEGGGNGGGGEAPKISMQSLTVSPGSSVTVIDNSTGEAVRIPVAVEKLTAGPLDMAAPGQTTNLDVALGIGDAAKVTAAGTATPLASTPDFDLTTNVASFPLTLVSPYVTQLSGMTVESGTLNMNAAAAANANALNGQIDVRIGDFHLGEPDSETAARFQENYGVPVGLAVSVLKDSDGVIQLSLPVSGTVSEPSVDYSAVISKAIGGALTSLFPSGLLSSDAGFGIEPVLFEPGSAELTEEGQAAADPLLNALKAKSELRLRVCGKGARADFLAMRNLAPDAPLPAEKVSDQEAQDLLKLAQERGGALRQYFVSNGIAEQRIGECRTSYSVESDAPPRAEVQL